MIVSIHQPAYLPWLGYLDRIARSDVFIFLDTVQYEKNSFINRNRIKTPSGPLWLTVPVKMKGHILSTLQETEINQAEPWRDKHLKSIYYNYRRAPRFEECYARLEVLFSQEFIKLADMCFHQLEFWLKEAGIGTKLIRAQNLPVSANKSDLVLEICRSLEATEYISGPLGRDYLRISDFEETGIKLEFHEYSTPLYPQQHGAFIPNLSIVDYWMHDADFEKVINKKTD